MQREETVRLSLWPLASKHPALQKGKPYNFNPLEYKSRIRKRKTVGDNLKMTCPDKTVPAKSRDHRHDRSLHKGS